MRWISTIAGLIATAAAALVMVSLSPTSQGEATSSSMDSAEPTTTVAVTTIAPPSTPAVVDSPDLSIDGLDEIVSAAIVGAGYSEFVAGSTLEEELPASVVDALITEGAVLVIADEGDG